MVRVVDCKSILIQFDSEYRLYYRGCGEIGKHNGLLFLSLNIFYLSNNIFCRDNKKPKLFK